MAIRLPDWFGPSIGILHHFNSFPLPKTAFDRPAGSECWSAKIFFHHSNNHRLIMHWPGRQTSLGPINIDCSTVVSRNIQEANQSRREIWPSLIALKNVNTQRLACADIPSQSHLLLQGVSRPHKIGIMTLRYSSISGISKCRWLLSFQVLSC